MKSRMALSWLTVVFFLFISSTAMAGDIQWLGLGGYIPGADVSISFETDPPAGDTIGSLAIDPAGGEIVKPLQLPDDFLLSKVHICFPESYIPDGLVTVKIYQDLGIPIPPATVITEVVLESIPPLVAPTPPDGCIEWDVFGATDPPTLIVPADGQLYLGIGVADSLSPVYLKAVGIEEYSDAFEIDGCDTGVMNILIPGQGLLSDLIAECEVGPPKNHGQYVKCVSHTLNALKKSGWISGKEKGKIQRCAAKADIP